MALSYIFLLVECLVSSMLLTSISSTTAVNEYTALFLIILNAIVFMFCIYKSTDGKKELIIILAISFLFRILLLLIDRYAYNYFVLPASGGDTQLFHLEALQYKNMKFLDNPYSYIVGIIYSLCKNQRIIAHYFNLLLSMSTLVTTINILKELNINYKIIVITTFILGILPNYAMLSVILLRESIMIFFLAISLLEFIKWWKYGNLISFAKSIIYVLLSSIFHSGVIANAIGYMIVFILFNNKEREMKIDLKSILSVVVTIVLISTLSGGFSDLFLSKFQNVGSIEDINYSLELGETGGESSYDVGGEINSFADIIINSPIRAFYFLTSPLPWQWRGLNDIIAFLFSAMLYIIAFIYAAKAIKGSNKEKNRSLIKALIIICIAGAIVFAWGTSNAGTAMRHRDKFIVNYIVMIAVSMEVISKQRKRQLN